MSHRDPLKARRQPTTFLVLSEADLEQLQQWRVAVSQRFDNCRVHVVLVGGASRSIPPKVTGFPTAAEAAQALRNSRLPNDRLFLVTRSPDDDLLRSFTSVGMFPTYVESERHSPAHLAMATEKRRRLGS